MLYFIMCGEKSNVVCRTENHELVEGRCGIKLCLQVTAVSLEILLGFFFVCLVINHFVFSGALCPSHVLELLPVDYWT